MPSISRQITSDGVCCMTELGNRQGRSVLNGTNECLVNHWTEIRFQRRMNEEPWCWLHWTCRSSTEYFWQLSVLSVSISCSCMTSRCLSERTKMDLLRVITFISLLRQVARIHRLEKHDDKPTYIEGTRSYTDRMHGLFLLWIWTFRLVGRSDTTEDIQNNRQKENQIINEN